MNPFESWLSLVQLLEIASFLLSSWLPVFAFAFEKTILISTFEGN